MQEELAAMEENDVWELVPRSPNQNVIGSKWIFVNKFKEDGSIERRKARLVAEGFKQRPGVDFDQTFAPVVHKTTFQTIFHIAAQQGLHIHQMDVKTAYLNGERREDVHMKQPPSFEDPARLEWVCRLKRSIYGLKQSARCWYEKLRDSLHHLGLKVNLVDPSLFQREHNGKVFCVMVYFDDLILGASCLKEFTNFKVHMGIQFTMKDMGEVQY